MADLMDRPRLSESSSGPREAPIPANEGWIRSGGDIIKEYLGERNLFSETPGSAPKNPSPEAEKASMRSDTEIIKEFLGERNLFSDVLGGSGSGAHSEQSGGVKAAGGAPARQPFSDSSWLDKFLDERDKELDCVLEDSDEEDEGGVMLGAADVSKVPRTHLIGRPTSVGAEELIARHKRSYEMHCGIDYNDWTSVALRAGGDATAADENVGGGAAPGGDLSVEEILTDDFDSSSACSSDDSGEAGAPIRWPAFGELAGSEKAGKVLGENEGQKERGRPNQAVGLANDVKGTCGATTPELLSASDVFGLVRSESADRELYKEVVRAAERGASLERERMDAVLSATVASTQGGATRMKWSLSFANPELEDEYRRSNIASGGDADYLCAVLRIWFSLLHLYMLARQFSILKEIRWGWIPITAPGRPLLSTSLEWNIAGLVLMATFLYMHLCQRPWWNRNRLPLLSLYLGTVWIMEIWYTLASQDAPWYRMVRLGSPAFFMSFMYNVPFVLHMRFRALVLTAQLGALMSLHDVTMCPWIVLFHSLSSAVAYALDRRSRRTFLDNLPPCFLPRLRNSQSSTLGGARNGSFLGGVGQPACCEALHKRQSAGARAADFGGGPAVRGDSGGGLAGEGQGAADFADVREGGSGESTLLEDRLREQLRQRRPSLGGFAGGFAGVGCVKTGTSMYNARLQAGQSKDRPGEQVD